jgi:hypothetical protein
LHVVGDELGDVCRMAVQDQEDTALAAPHEGLKQLDE